ncbi:transposase, partial [Thiolapillus sp.]
MLQPETELSPQLNFGEITMSCFEKLTHVLWHCQYHIVWVPKYRYRVLTGDVA